MRQYFYLVVRHYDESTTPLKVFLQKNEAIRWGRREATKTCKETGDSCYEFALYKQEITRTGTLEYCSALYPYKEENNQGADFDIDIKRY